MPRQSPKTVRRSEWRRRPGRSSTSWIRRPLRFAIYARDKFDCVYCHGIFPPAYDGRGLTLEHIVPRSKGGTHAPENLVTACARCNYARQHKDHPARELRRLLKLAAQPLNRELGRVLAALF